MAQGWWVVTYVAQGSGAAQLGTVIVQAPSAAAARKAAAAQLPPDYQVGAARGPYPSQQAAANAGVRVTGGHQENPIPGTAPPGTPPPTGGGQVAAVPSNLASSGSPCLIAMPTLNLGITSVNGACIFTKTNARALVGGMLLAGAAILAMTAAVLLLAEGFKGSGAQQAATKIGTTFTPVGRTAKAVGRGFAAPQSVSPRGNL